MTHYRCSTKGERQIKRDIRKGNKLWTVHGRWIKTWNFDRHFLGAPSAGGSWTPEAVLRDNNEAFSHDPCVVPTDSFPGLFHMPGMHKSCERKAEWEHHGQWDH